MDLSRFMFAMCVMLALVSQMHGQDNKGGKSGLFTKEDSVLFGGQLPVVNIFASDLDLYKYDVLKRRVIKVYPYVEQGKEILRQIQENESEAKKREHKKYIKSTEKDLRSKFEAELKDLTINEGQVLVKLVNRETGNSCYKLIKEMKGSITAFFYQQVGKYYGYDLKAEYDPKREHDMEFVIKDLQSQGKLPALKKLH